MVSERHSPVGGQLVPCGPHGLHGRGQDPRMRGGVFRFRLNDKSIFQLVDTGSSVWHAQALGGFGELVGDFRMHSRGFWGASERLWEDFGNLRGSFWEASGRL